MKKRVVLLFVSIFSAIVFVCSLEKLVSGATALLSFRQETQSTKKPEYDYMSTFLSRDTNPLGLKEDIALKKLLDQSSIKWAIRSSKRHILN